ncbi:Golgi-associated RAB2 interactor protein 5B [Talpa occidentalis]|uniref:Golgi-associated RAB2 interactor protein 5B n=1 Tax=Talpa occidentalis TaxID=50954 RepID=UPI0023F91153|nr:Golgi-associated RAB2 interactor protein 5B [Talpa occidentalis]
MNWLWNIRRVDPQQGSPKWVPTLGELQKTLQKGEHLPLRPLPMFESNFVQVTNGGSPVYVHHGANRLTMGVAASLPGLVLPDILLIARPPEGRDGPNVVLTRMIPLDLARLYVHDLAAWRLKLRLVTGRYYYLELDAPYSEGAFLFNRWIRLIDLLQQPSNTWVPRTAHTPPLGLASTEAPASTWRLQGPAHTRRSVMIVQPTFPYAVLTSQKQKKAKALKRRFKSQAVGDSEPLLWSKLEQAGAKETPSKRSHPDLHKSQHPVSEKPSITIRTIFSIISNTVSNSPSSAKACSSDSDGAALRGLLEPATRCVRPDTRSASPLGSYDHLERRLWQQDIQDLMDPESSTLSSSSLGPAPCAPAPRPPAPCPLRRPKEKGRPVGAQRRPKPPPPPRAPPAPPSSRKAPFLLDRSHKIPAVRAPSRKLSGGAPRKAPEPPQKAPAPAGPARKGPQASATPHGAPSTPASARKTRPVSPKGPGGRTPSQRAPPAPGAPPKAASPAARRRKSQVPPAPPPRAAGAAARPVAWDPAEGVLLPSGSGEALPGPRAAEGQPGPLARVGTQETEVVEVRAQQTSRQLPGGTTKVDSTRLVVSRAHELSLGGWTGAERLQDVTLRKTEETVLDAPGLRTTRLGQQHKWVRTRELAAGGPVQAHSRPFSAEGLALAKLMILANSAEAALRPPPGALPSWLTVPLAPSLDVTDPRLGRPSGAPEGPLHAGPGAKGSTPAPAEAEAPPGAPPRTSAEAEARPDPPRRTSAEAVDRPGGPRRTSAEAVDRPGGPRRTSAEAEARPGGPRRTSAEAADAPPGGPREPTAEASPSKLASSNPKTGVSEAPIPLPALRWEDMVSPFPTVLSPTPQMETRMSPQHKGAPPESEGAQNQRPLATVGSTSEILLPSLLDISDVGDDTGQVEELNTFSRLLSPRPPGRRVLGLRETGAERPGAAASGGD